MLSTDLSEALTDLARDNFKAAGFANGEARHGRPGVSLPDLPFDGVVSRVGLIFFPDPQAGSVRRRNVGAQAGRFASVLWSTRPPDDVPLFLRIRSASSAGTRHSRRPARPAGPLQPRRAGLIESLFERAGLVDIATRKVPAPLVLGNAAECLRFEQEFFGALHQMLSNLDDAGKAMAWAEVGTALAAFEKDGRFEGPCVMIAAVGRKP